MRTLPLRLAAALALGLALTLACSSSDSGGGGVPVESVTFPSDTASVNADRTITLTATVLPGDATNKALTWTSSNTAAATVPANFTGATATISGVAEGVTTIRAASQSDPAKYDECLVTVRPAGSAILVNSVSLPGSLATIVGGGTTITATVLPDDADNKSLNWTCTPSSVASLGGGANALTRTVTGLAVGTATITATSMDGSNRTSNACTLTVGAGTSVPVASVGVSPGSATVEVGDTVALTASVLPVGASNRTVEWTSSSPNATVTQGGGTGLTATVRGVSAGPATITATSLSDPSKSGSCTVTVTAASPVDVYVGGSFGLIKNGVADAAYSGSTVQALQLDGDGVVYACGFTGDEASFWRDGARVTLPRSAGTEGAGALGMCIDGGTVYIAGMEASPTALSYSYSACLWTVPTAAGGTPARVALDRPPGATDSWANCVCRYSGGTYVAGGSHIDDGSPFGWEGATVWLTPMNLVRTYDYDGGWPVEEVVAIAAGPDNNLHGGGYFGLGVISPATGDLVGLPIENGSVFAIRFVNGVRYACGYESSEWPPCYWIGTARTDLPDRGGSWSEAWAVDFADGQVWCAGRNSHGGSFSPELWRGASIWNIDGWSGNTSKGSAWALAVRAR